jgi:hypothetical protein
MATPALSGRKRLLTLFYPYAEKCIESLRRLQLVRQTGHENWGAPSFSPRIHHIWAQIISSTLRSSVAVTTTRYARGRLPVINLEFRERST